MTIGSTSSTLAEQRQARSSIVRRNHSAKECFVLFRDFILNIYPAVSEKYVFHLMNRFFLEFRAGIKFSKDMESRKLVNKDIEQTSVYLK